jgi:hypothetical protein
MIFGDGLPSAIPYFDDVAIGTGADGADDTIIIWELGTRGSLSVDTGGGDDWVFLSNAGIGDGFGFDELSVNTGAGIDTVTVKNGTLVQGWVDIQTYDSLAENDQDVVYFDTDASVMRDVDVRTGGGDDVMLVTNPNHTFITWGGLTAGSLTIDLGAGDDEAYIRAVRTGGNFSLYTGTGADVVTMDNRPIDKFDGTFFVPRVGGDLLVQTYELLTPYETDRDEVRVLDAIVNGNFRATLGSGDDFFSMEDAEIIVKDFRVEMDAGNDEAEVSGFFLEDLLVWMGEGDDVLRLGQTWATLLIAHGQFDFDTLTTAFNTTALAIHYLGWETINGQPV